MHFKVTARTILQLGSELISSDAIAFYELIKNAFDAGSRKVEVRVVVRIPQNLVTDALSSLSTYSTHPKPKETRVKLLDNIIGSLDLDAPESNDLKHLLEKNTSDNELITLLKQSNYILIKDLGEGMSLDDLGDIYLTIGTRNRRKQRNSAQLSGNRRPILGEKGLGRLSVMRLGEGLIVETTKAGEKNYNLLEIDWTAFSHDSDDLIENIFVDSKIGRLKDDSSLQGTIIRIYDLRADWSKAKLEAISREQLSRFIDPFGKTNRDFINLWFNKQPIILVGIDRILFSNAHAFAKCQLAFDVVGKPTLTGEIYYRTYDRNKTFTLAGTHLANVVNEINPGIAFDTLHSLGPFSAEFHWFNRRLLTKKEGVIDADYIKELVATWGGGLMVYRDGFRVNPYGGPNDDWLNLDPKAFGSGGYKVNRKQLVGKVDITSSENATLLDQTNREGLRDNLDKQALVKLLQYFLWDEFKDFLNAIEEEEKANLAALSLEDIESRIYLGQHKVKEALKYLTTNYPVLSAEKDIIKTIEDVLEESTALFKSAKASAEVLEQRLSTTINLAGLGLMIDVIAHELNRATQHAIQTINTLTTQELSERTASSMSTLRAQLKTLQTRLKVLDPLGPSGRQHKTSLDLKTLIKDTIQHHQAQFERHRINCVIKDGESQHGWTIQAVPGMIVQVLENLISNSVYWLKQEQIVNKLANAEIRIEIDRNRGFILFSDNGPGIPNAKKDEVFRPFVSTKAPGQGKGLGLYISREIAKYHGADLYLKIDNSSEKFLHTFVLDLHNSI
jgi:signal transduction histidine kinase